MDPKRRALYLDWKVLAEATVGVLRVAYARTWAIRGFEDVLRSLMVRLRCTITVTDYG